MESDAAENIRQRFYRLHSAASDLHQSELIAGLILDEHLHDQPEENRILIQALNCALVVTYSRPFVGGNRRRSQHAARLPRRYLRNLEEHERLVHDGVIEDRHFYFAHADLSARVYTPEVWVIGDREVLMPWSCDPRPVLTEEAVRVLRGIAHNLHEQVLWEQVALEPQVLQLFPRVNKDEPSS